MVKIIGHRGARNLWPENSIEGFRKLIDLGVEGVEFDVHQTRDNEIVVIHDPTLERTTHGSGTVGDRTLAELQATRLRDSRECVASLDEVLNVLRGSALELHVEIKTDAFGNAYSGFEERVLSAIRRHDLVERSVLTCFAPEVLETVRRIDTDIRVLASLDRRSAEMMGGLTPALNRFVAIEGCLLAVEKSLLGLCLPTCLATFGRERLGAWVPNDETELALWLAQPIRQITTDRPDLALKVRAELGR